jgi:hypothetical protein
MNFFGKSKPVDGTKTKAGTASAKASDHSSKPSGKSSTKKANHAEGGKGYDLPSAVGESSGYGSGGHSSHDGSEHDRWSYGSHAQYGSDAADAHVGGHDIWGRTGGWHSED